MRRWTTRSRFNLYTDGRSFTVPANTLTHAGVMAKINPPASSLKPLPLEAQMSLRADEQFLRWLTLAEPSVCECARRTHFWSCDYCSVIRSGEARPVCPLGLVA